MEVKEVVKIAIDYVADVFDSETPTNTGLEEITFNENEKLWKVTVGFSRPWDYQTPGFVSDLRLNPQNDNTRLLKSVMLMEK